MGVIGAFGPIGRGFFTFGVLVIKTGRLVPAFLLIRASVLRSGNTIGPVVTARYKLRLSCKSGPKTINSSWGRKEEEIINICETRAFVRVAFAY